MPSILWSAPVPPSEKHPNNTMLPPTCFTVGMVLFCLQPPPFSSKHNDSHYGQTVIFLFHQLRTFLQKVQSLSPCAVANHSLALLWWFWSSGFFLAEQPFRLCRYRTRFAVDIDTFVHVSSSIFPRSFAVVLGLICTFRTKVRSSLADIADHAGRTRDWTYEKKSAKTSEEKL